MRDDVQIIRPLCLLITFPSQSVSKKKKKGSEYLRYLTWNLRVEIFTTRLPVLLNCFLCERNHAVLLLALLSFVPQFQFQFKIVQAASGARCTKEHDHEVNREVKI